MNRNFEISYPIFQTNKPFKYNQYATKKTLAQGLLDIGLLMANASQLKALIDLGPNTQDYFWANVVNILGIRFYLYLVNFKMPSGYFDKKVKTKIVHARTQDLHCLHEIFC